MSSRLRAARRSGERGILLIELTVACALLVVLAAAISIVIGAASRNGNAITNATLAQTDARAAIDVLAQDIRQAISPDDGTTAPVEALSATQVTFYSPDRQVPHHMRKISVRLNGTSLERAIATSSDNDGSPWTIPALGSWQRIASNISNADVFSALDSAGATTTTASAARSIVIKLVVDAPGTQERRVTLTNAATIRAS